MSRVLLTTFGSLGDLHPLLSIGLELRRRGHNISFCTSASYQERIESLGFGFHPMRPDLTPENAPRVIREIMDPQTGVERLMRGYLFPSVRDMFDDLTHAADANDGVDLLVSGELVYAAPLLAEQRGIRWTTCITSPMSFFSAHDPPVLAPFPRLCLWLRRFGPGLHRILIRTAKFSTRSWSQPLRRLRSELGLRPGKDPIHEGKYSPSLVLAMFSRVLANLQPDWPPNTVITGFPFYDGSAEEHPLPLEVKTFLQSGPPPIVFTLGSAAVYDPGNFFDASAEAARRLSRRAILLIGKNASPASLPENVLAIDYLPFAAIFSQASAIVNQGGIGTIGQALRAGCPMLVMPYNYDQPDNAARLVRLGVARTISRKDYSAERAAGELNALLSDPGFARKAAEARQRIQEEHGAAAACDALESLLARRHSGDSLICR
jgi:UDP:flavonoid glycosyltransferase YjiC (YdhE family)